jgi:hypothetical protein
MANVLWPSKSRTVKALAPAFAQVTALRPKVRAGADMGWTALLRKLDGIAPGWDN